MAISEPPAPAAVAAAGEERGWEDATDDADAMSNVPSREARQEMIKAVRATVDRIHVLSSMDEELKRLLIKEFRVVAKAHGEAVATKGEHSDASLGASMDARAGTSWPTRLRHSSQSFSRHAAMIVIHVTKPLNCQLCSREHVLAYIPPPSPSHCHSARTSGTGMLAEADI